MKIAIDPGHGMSNRTRGVYDPGAIHVENGATYREADIALRYALAVRDMLRAKGAEVFLTREHMEDPAPVRLRARSAEQAGCEAFVSLHLNDSESDTANGLEVLYRDANDLPLAQALLQGLTRAAGLRPRRVVERRDLAVLRFNGPAVLIELGFIASDHDRDLLLSTVGRDALCQTIAETVLNAAFTTRSRAPQGGKAVYRLPSYAEDILSESCGVPWSDSAILTDFNFYEGLAENSFHRFGSGALFYESKFAIDGDGSGDNPESDPTFQPDTSLHDAAGRPLNSRDWPFIVLPLPRRPAPRTTWESLGAGLGDLGVCFFRNGRSCAVLYGDKGPRWRLGEGSIKAARALGINSNPTTGGLSADEIPPGVIHFVFPGSRSLASSGGGELRTLDTPETIQRRAMALFEAFAGRPRTIRKKTAAASAAPAVRRTARPSRAKK